MTRSVMINVMSDPALEAICRPLTERERELVMWLIDHGEYADRQLLQAEITRLTVRERCTCGCPTVYFALDAISSPEQRGTSRE